MDEVLFKLSENLETLQIWLTELAQKLTEAVEVTLSSETALRLQDTISETSNKCYELSSFVIGRAQQALSQPTILVSRLGRLLSHDFNRATLYAGAVGFVIGGGIGIFLGVYMQSPSQPVTLMKAIASTAFTGPDSVVVLEDAIVPQLIHPDDVLIQVKAGTLDSLDIQVSCGYGKTLRSLYNRYNPHFNPLPVILGREGSGIVSEVGSYIEHVEAGDSVMFLSPPWYHGTLAEWIVIKGDFVIKKPNRISFEAAATLPYCGFNAWQAVTLEAGLNVRNAHKHRVLVHSGNTNSGWMVTQLCVNLGCHVTVTCLFRATALIKSLGVEEVVQLECEEAETILMQKDKFDIVFNTVGSTSQSFCESLCSPHGKVIQTFPPSLRSDDFGVLMTSLYSLWFSLSQKLCGDNRQRVRKGLEEVKKLADTGRIRPVVEKVYITSETEKLLNKLESSRASVLGKAVISISKSRRESRDRPDLLS